MIPSFPKIFQLGTRYVEGLFDGTTYITEKVDGSFFAFGKVGSEFIMRSKGQRIYPENPEGMFKQGVEYVMSIKDKIPDDYIFYCEYLQKPKHNVLRYNSIPTNHLVLFGVTIGDGYVFSRALLEDLAKHLNIDIVPLIGISTDKRPPIEAGLDIESYLGGPKIEGVVITNYDKDVLVGGQVMPIMVAKYVSQEFKEVHRASPEFKSKDKLLLFKESFRTEARWRKAVIHLKEQGLLKGEPSDIGLLMKEVSVDITEECKEDILKFLWENYGKDIIRNCGRGLPEWYKEQLLGE